jgi:anti-sigma factor RsiW
MSSATENTTAQSECDRLLDYVYGELEGNALEQFKAHLDGCEKCKRELAGLERVRGAVRAAIAPIEPPVDKMSALHAQLMHAAAQARPRRSKTGKVLMFARRVATHPGYAAAAMLALVGGAVGMMWTMGRLEMPAEKVASAPVAASAPKPAAAAPAPLITTAPAGGEVTVVPKEPSKDTAKNDIVLQHNGYADREAKLFLKTEAGPPTSTMAVSRPEPARHAAATRAKAKEVPPADGLLGEGFAGGVARDATMEPKAPAKKMAKAEEKRQDDNRVLAPNAPPPPPAAAPTAAARPAQATTAPAAPPPAPIVAETPIQAPAEQALAVDGKVGRVTGTTSNSQGLYRGSSGTAAQKPQVAQRPVQRNLSDADVMRKQADDAAGSGRCDEAIKLFQELEKQHPGYNVSPKERLQYVRCLRMAGRYDAAQNELDALKVNKAQTNQMIVDEQTALEAQRKSAERTKKAKAAKSNAAVDDAKAAPSTAAQPSY